MLKIVTALLLISWAEGFPVTQEELAQYVARQQTAGAERRQQVYQVQPQEARQQVYQAQPQEGRQAAYQPQYYQAPRQEAQAYYQPQARPKGGYAGGKGGQAAPQEAPEDYDPNPHYQFGFDINDDEFTNYHKRKEQRDGDKISGSYSVVDSDGYVRTVTYTADPLEGFKAEVVREPTDIKVKIPQPQAQYADQYQQIAPRPNLAARKQQTQQYLKAASPVDSKPQYIVRPEHTQVFAPAPQQVKLNYTPQQGIYQGSYQQ